MCSVRGCSRYARAGFPIRKSSDQRLYTATRGLSQCPASFIGTWRQGIHRKPLVASPRDAEKLILFGLHQKISHYSVGKVLFSPSTGEGCASPVSRAPLDSRLWLFNKATRLTAGSRISPMRFEPYFY